MSVHTVPYGDTVWYAEHCLWCRPLLSGLNLTGWPERIKIPESVLPVKADAVEGLSGPSWNRIEGSGPTCIA